MIASTGYTDEQITVILTEYMRRELAAHGCALHGEPRLVVEEAELNEDGEEDGGPSHRVRFVGEFELVQRQPAEQLPSGLIELPPTVINPDWDDEDYEGDDADGGIKDLRDEV